MVRPYTDYLLVGKAQLLSPWFSNRWQLHTPSGSVLAHLERLARIHVATITLPDQSRWIIEPAGQSTMRLMDKPDNEVARIIRRSWWGRRWEVSGTGFWCELVSHPRPRKWQFQIGGSSVAELSGSPISYNRVNIDAIIALPLPALLLGWHVIARPWEAAAVPNGLIPAPKPPAKR